MLTLSLLAMIAGGFLFSATNRGVAREAEQLAQIIRNARLKAVVSGQPQLVGGAACRGAVAHSLQAAVAFPARGLLFAADGLPRACNGGGLGNATITLSLAGEQAAVVVSTFGRVRWELR